MISPEIFRPNFPAKFSGQIFRPNFPAKFSGRNYPAEIIRPKLSGRNYPAEIIRERMLPTYGQARLSGGEYIRPDRITRFFQESAHVTT
jgi:hypothetical protein